MNRHLRDLSNRLSTNDYLCNTLSFADITVWDWIDQTDDAFGSRAAIRQHSNLAAWLERIESLPRLVAYWKSRG